MLTKSQGANATREKDLQGTVSFWLSKTYVQASSNSNITQQKPRSDRKSAGEENLGQSLKSRKALMEDHII